LEWDIESNTNKIENYKKKNIEAQHTELEQVEDDRSNTKIEIDKLKIEVRNKLDKIEKLGDLKYDSNCNFCMSNPFTLDAIKTKKDLEEDRILASQYVDEIDNLDDKIIL